jgi:hypothetical protein
MWHILGTQATLSSSEWVCPGRSWLILLDGRLTFPVAQQVPGLYRFRIRGSAGEAVYIGESENLARRFRLYSSPGPSQQTNLRLNAKFRKALSERAEIGVAIVTTEAWIDVRGTQVVADLSSKAMRRLFESAAVVESTGDAIESLNL